MFYKSLTLLCIFIISNTFMLMLYSSPDHQPSTLQSAICKVLVLIVFFSLINLLHVLKHFSYQSIAFFSNIFLCITFKCVLFEASILYYSTVVESSGSLTFIFIHVVNDYRGKSSFPQTAKARGLELFSGNENWFWPNSRK